MPPEGAYEVFLNHPFEDASPTIGEWDRSGGRLSCCLMEVCTMMEGLTSVMKERQQGLVKLTRSPATCEFFKIRMAESMAYSYTVVLLFL
jgi:hypothetical protein